MARTDMQEPGDPSPITRAETEMDEGLDKAAAGKITEIQGDSHFYETITAAPLNPWSKTSLQLYSILLVAALNATASGFDGVSTIHETCILLERCLLTQLIVNLQLDQRYDPVSDVLPP